MKQTPLYTLHAALNPKWADFAGWQMPIHYGSQIQEHHAVRQAAGVFDVSHMQSLLVQGAKAKPFLAYLLANNIGKLTPGKAMYTCMLNPQGGIIDDLIVYYFDDQCFRIVRNAGCAEKDFAWIAAQAQAFGDVKLIPEGHLCILAVQGPKAIARLLPLLPPEQSAALTVLKNFEVTQADGWTLARTGYTGEDGVELILPAEAACDLWVKCLQADIKPCGLGARDTLRLEAGLNLYGQDMTEAETPFEVNLGWTVALEPAARDFVGRKALEKQLFTGVAKQMVHVLLQDKGVLRHGQKVQVPGLGEGEIKSGSFSPTLGKAIGFASVPVGHVAEACVFIRDKEIPLAIVSGAFVRKGRPSQAVQGILKRESSHIF